jgi:hypothetical protein
MRQAVGAPLSDYRLLALSNRRFSLLAITLYHGGGASDFTTEGPALSPDEWAKLRGSAVRLMRARSQQLAVEVLERLDFTLLTGSNYFNDQFTVLQLVTSDVERYTRLGERNAEPEFSAACAAIAKTISEIGPYVRFIEVTLDTDSAPAPVATPTLLISSATVERALDDATLLIRASGAVSAIDRVHTALHGFLRAACERLHLELKGTESSSALFRRLRSQHPALTDEGPRSEDIRKICNSMGAILDALDPLRNQASVAHPNPELLGEEEAMLVINSARTILHYLNSKLA